MHKLIENEIIKAAQLAADVVFKQADPDQLNIASQKLINAIHAITLKAYFTGPDAQPIQREVAIYSTRVLPDDMARLVPEVVFEAPLPSPPEDAEIYIPPMPKKARPNWWPGSGAQP